MLHHGCSLTLKVYQPKFGIGRRLSLELRGTQSCATLCHVSQKRYNYSNPNVYYDVFSSYSSFKLLEIAWCTKTKPTESIPNVNTMVFKSESEIMMRLELGREDFVQHHSLEFECVQVEPTEHYVRIQISLQSRSLAAYHFGGPFKGRSEFQYTI